MPLTVATITVNHLFLKLVILDLQFAVGVGNFGQNALVEHMCHRELQIRLSLLLPLPFPMFKQFDWLIARSVTSDWLKDRLR